MRDIRRELTDAGFHLEHFENLLPERIWVGDSIRIQGSCGTVGAQFPVSQTWFATLPLR